VFSDSNIYLPAPFVMGWSLTISLHITLKYYWWLRNASFDDELQ